MTVREIYEHDVKGLPSIEQLRLASLILEQVTRGQSPVDEDLHQQIRLATPSNAALLRAATNHGPPQSWWDEGGDPTESCKKQ